MDLAETLDDFPGDYLPRASGVLVPAFREVILGRHCEHIAMVSPEDYEWVIQWKWNFKRSRGGNIYARRGGGRNSQGLRPTILLHNAIMNRMGIPRPEEGWTVDHKNRNSLDNTRPNLRWLDTSSQNKNQRRWLDKGSTPA